MMKRFPRSISTMLFICFAFSAICQQDDRGAISEDEPELFRLRIGEIYGEITSPLNTFGDRMGETALGLSAAYLFQTKVEGPIFVGLDFQWAPFYRVSTTFTDVVDGFVTDLSERTRTSLWSTHLITRFHPFNNFPLIDPFVEGLIGAKMMMTNTSVIILNTSENIDFDVQSADVSFSYGFSAGFQMRVYQYQYYLSAKASYLRGTSNGFYAIPDDLRGLNDLTIDDLEFSNAPMDILRWQLGLSISF